VLTRGATAFPAGVEAVASIDAALALLPETPELCVIGGAALFAQTLPVARRLYLTEVHGEVEGDVHFPNWNRADWRETERREHPADERHLYAMSFVTLER